MRSLSSSRLIRALAVALAIAVPVTLLLQHAFTFAVDAGQPKRWLEWRSFPLKLVFGFVGHRSWHYTRAAPPRKFVRWHTRHAGDEPWEIFTCSAERIVQFVSGRVPSWLRKAVAASDADRDARVWFRPPTAGAEARARRPSVLARLSSAIGGGLRFSTSSAASARPLSAQLRSRSLSPSPLLASSSSSSAPRRAAVDPRVSRSLSPAPRRAGAPPPADRPPLPPVDWLSDAGGCAADAEFEEGGVGGLAAEGAHEEAGAPLPPPPSRASALVRHAAACSTAPPTPGAGAHARAASPASPRGVPPLAAADRSGGGGDGGAAMRRAVERRRAKRVATCVGVAITYVVWAALAWVVVTYASLIYRTLGPQVEATFAKTFGAAWALDQAQQWKAVLKVAATGVAVSLVLDRLYLSSNASWMEAHLDQVALSALLCRHTGTTLWRRINLFYNFRHRSCKT